MSALITTTQNPGEIVDWGSEVAYARIIKDLAYTELSTPDTFAELPIRESFDMSPAVNEAKKTSEGGNERITSTTESWILKLIFQQAGKAVTYDLPKLLIGKYALIVLELTDTAHTVDGAFLYLACIGRMWKKPGMKSKTSPEYEFQLYQPTVNVSFDLGPTTDVFPKFSAAKADRAATTHNDTSTAGKLVITAGQYIGMAAVIPGTP